MQRAPNGNLSAAVLSKTPNSRAGQRDERITEAIVIVEVIECRWYSALGEVSWRSTDHEAYGREPSCDQAAIRQPPDPDRHVPPFFQQIDVPVVQAKFDRDARMQAMELRGEPRDMHHPERSGRADAQQAFHGSRLSGGVGIGFRNLRQHALGTFQICQASIGQCQSARCPVDQPRPEPGLKRVEVADRHGRRHAHGARRSRQAAQLYRANKDLHARQPIGHLTLLVQGPCIFWRIITSPAMFHIGGERI